MKTNQPVSKLYNLPKYKGREDNLKLLRIICCDKYVKVDFGYIATDYYVRGGWVHIKPQTYLKDTKTGDKKKLIKAVNIPIAPVDLNFKTAHDWLYFSLYFEPISDNVKTFDIIESESNEPTDFNFYNIKLDKFLKIKT